ncbi:unnamed protein product [Eruca vesicaria subsp. sativa]|uniref:Uncharacterized protein n=1 Tax=Eruca vesicaria subsp. sativa TaxID=29727 RepID=A0ABC8JP93_ERUVS|nr:unnamed protein product [Eruca vesicaria subsp. sativa]
MEKKNSEARGNEFSCISVIGKHNYTTLEKEEVDASVTKVLPQRNVSNVNDASAEKEIMVVDQRKYQTIFHLHNARIGILLDHLNLQNSVNELASHYSIFTRTQGAHKSWLTISSKTNL